MVRQTNLTGAESCWDDEPESEANCEAYLRAQNSRRREPVADAEEEKENDDSDTEDENNSETGTADKETTVVAEVADDDDDDDGVDEDEAEEPADEESAHLEGRKMAKAKTGKTKAESIREVIASRQAAGKDLRPRDIIETLTKKGIEVNASQVSITLRSMGVPAIKRGAAAPKSAVKPETNGEDVKSRVTAKVRAPISGDTAGVSVEAMEHLLESAADFIHEAGGFDRARSLLEMCNKVIQRT